LLAAAGTSAAAGTRATTAAAANWLGRGDGESRPWPCVNKIDLDDTAAIA